MKNKWSDIRTNSAFGVNRKACLWAFLCCLILALMLTPGSVLGQDPTPEPVIHTIANPSGTTINLFDYYVYGTNTGDDGRFPSITYINNAGNPNNQEVNTGINDGHDLKFIQNHWSYSGGARQIQDGQIVDREYWWNHYIGQGDGQGGQQGLNPALSQGIVLRKLGADGFPVLAVGNGESLAYLFTPTNLETTGFTPNYPVRDVYPNVNNLFYVDETGHYTYDSNWERALLDPSCQSGATGGNCDFTITQGQDPDPDNQTKANRPQFLPLGDPFPKERGPL